MSKRKLSKHRSPKHNYKAKLERCIMAVKSKQKAHCSKTNYKSFWLLQSMGRLSQLCQTI